MSAMPALVTRLVLPSGAPWPASPTSATTSRPTRSSRDRKSTRLNSSHTVISYAVFCLNNQYHTAALQLPTQRACLAIAGHHIHSARTHPQHHPSLTASTHYSHAT